MVHKLQHSIVDHTLPNIDFRNCWYSLLKQNCLTVECQHFFYLENTLPNSVELLTNMCIDATELEHLICFCIHRLPVAKVSSRQ